MKAKPQAPGPKPVGATRSTPSMSAKPAGAGEPAAKATPVPPKPVAKGALPRKPAEAAAAGAGGEAAPPRPTPPAAKGAPAGAVRAAPAPPKPAAAAAAKPTLPVKKQPQQPAETPISAAPKEEEKEEKEEEEEMPAPAKEVAAEAASPAAATAATAPANWPGTLPAWDVFCKELEDIFDAAVEGSSSSRGAGAPSQNLPAARCGAGFAVCTMDGHVHTHGAGCGDGAFSLQGAVWPLLFGLCPPGKAAEYIGKERCADDASGAVHSRAPNPLTKAGGIALSAIELAEAPAGEPWERLDAIAAAAGALAGSPVGFSMAAYAKAKRHSEAAWANGYALRAAGNLPGTAGVADVMDFFFQVNALQTTIAQAAVLAAAIANDGVSPKTKARTGGSFAQTVSMASAMGIAYDAQQKLPSAGGESGVVLVFIPHVCGIAVFSPELGKDGVSVAGADFVHKIAAKYKFK